MGKEMGKARRVQNGAVLVGSACGVLSTAGSPSPNYRSYASNDAHGLPWKYLVIIVFPIAKFHPNAFLPYPTSKF